MFPKRKTMNSLIVPIERATDGAGDQLKCVLLLISNNKDDLEEFGTVVFET